MSSITNSLNTFRALDDLGRLQTPVHRLHPLIKLMTTIIYLVVVVSFDRYEISALLPMFFYPVVVMAWAEIPAGAIIRKLLLVEPFILGIGILNPWFDPQTFQLAGMTLSKGWLTLASILIKGGLTVTAALLLISTTGIDGIALALRMLRIPRLLVLQLLLTYRYITVLLEETGRTLQAYRLRAPGQNGIQRSAWGSLAGQLLLRSFDRAERIYQAMCLRGFTGEYHVGNQRGLGGWDISYLAGWSVFLILARIYDLPGLIGAMIAGGIR